MHTHHIIKVLAIVWSYRIIVQFHFLAIFRRQMNERAVEGRLVNREKVPPVSPFSLQRDQSLR